MKRPPPPPHGAAAPHLIAIKSPSGHLIGYLDRARLILEVKPRAGRPVEEIDLRPYLVRDT